MKMQKVKLGDILDLQPKSKIKAGEGTMNGKYPFFTSSKIQDKFINVADYHYPSLIFGTGGDASVHFCNTDFSTSTDCLVFILRNNYNANLKYVYYYLFENIDLIKAGFKGCGLKHISRNYILDIEIDLPHIDQQDKLVYMLDCICSLGEKRKEQIKKLDLLIKSRFLEMFGDVEINTKGWELVTINNVCSSIVRGPFGSALKKEFFVPKTQDTYKVYEQKHAIQKSATIGDYYISKNKFLELTRFECCQGDFIMSCSGTMGELYQLPKGCEKGIINQALCKFTLKKEILPIYFLIYMKQTIKKLETKGSGIQNIAAVSFVKSMPICLPPLNLQNEFAEFVEQVDKIKIAVKTHIEKLETLKKSLMQQYFG